KGTDGIADDSGDQYDMEDYHIFSCDTVLPTLQIMGLYSMLMMFHGLINKCGLRMLHIKTGSITFTFLQKTRMTFLE
ncbi:MAG: hypothetical protein KA785_02170, partial [Spirochaetaceae bacterium]|nr:hypothetical protein [Spirochaetaceae bacterium]